MSNNNDRLSWNGTIENESSEFVLIPPGDYAFQVANIDQTVSNNSGNDMAVVHLKIMVDENTEITLKDYLVLTRASEWKLCAFFRAVGLKRSGEPFVMDFDAAVARRGMVKLTQEKFTKKDGTESMSNKVKNYIDPPEGFSTEEVPF
jgi:hypothetical protein